MIRNVALILTVLTGFSGLVYQVTWQRYLAALLGSHAEATAVVLGIFLGGLSIGYAAFGRVAGNITSSTSPPKLQARLLVTYGCIEIGIGLYALLFPWLFTGVQKLSSILPHASATLSFATDVALTALLVGPASALMGATIPLLTQSLSRGLSNATRIHAFIYAFNTVGAFAGALAAGFFLIPQFGLHACLFYMGLINLFAGFVFVALSRLPSTGETPERPSEHSETMPAHFRSFAVAAALSGFAMMTLQVILNRVGALSLGSSHFTFSMVVATFVLSIAIGSLLVSALSEVRAAYLILSQWLLVGILLAAQPFIEDAPYWALVVRRDFFPGTESNFYPYQFRVFSWMLALLIVPVGLSGAMLPLLFHHLRREVGNLGRVAGRLYAWNTAGSLAGALLGGYLLLFWFDLHHTYRLAVIALGIGAMLLTGRILRRGWWIGAVGLGLVLTGSALESPWDPNKLTAGAYRGMPLNYYVKSGRTQFAKKRWFTTKVIYSTDGPSTSVAVAQEQSPERESLAILVNGKSDSSIPGDKLTTATLGLLPALLAKNPERAFVIGFGTGYTVGVLGSLDTIRETIVSEISPGVISAAPYFESKNYQAASNPKTKIVRSDAFRALLRSDQQFDIIVSEPSNPWVAGVETLYSLEFLQTARSRLTPDGVYAHWFHLYEIDSPSVSLVIDTFLQVYERVAIWTVDVYDIIILGFNRSDGVIDLQEMEARFNRPDFNAAFSDVGIENFPSLLTHEAIPENTLSLNNPPPRTHTLFHPILSHDAARAFFVGAMSILPRSNDHRAAETGAKNSLIRRYLTSLPSERRNDAREKIVRKLCDPSQPACMTVLASWMHNFPDDPKPKALLDELRRDALLNNRPDDATSFSSVSLRRIGALYGSSGFPHLGDSHAGAERVLTLFHGFYSHAAPFNALALHSTWERCAKTEKRCSDELEKIRNIGIRPVPGQTNLGLP